MKKKDLDENKIIEMYKNGLTIEEISRIFKIRNPSISQILKNNNIKIKHGGIIPKEIKYKIQKTDRSKEIGDCHICTSHYINKSGYSRGRFNGSLKLLHRYIYEQNFGTIPDDLLIRHKCDMPSCIFIDHLLLGTKQDNSNDMIERERQSKGEDKSAAKLTEKDVRFIRENKDKYTQVEFAKMFNMSERNIWNALHYKSWKHVK